MGEMPSPSPPSMAFVRPSVENRPPSLARSPERGRFPMTHSALARQEEEHDHEAGERPRRGHPQTRTISSLPPSSLPPSHETRGHFSSPWLPKRNDVRTSMHGHSPARARRPHCPSKVSSDTTTLHYDEMRPHGSTRRLVMLPSGKIKERL